MQPKESKTKWHFTISLIKSFVRILAGVSLLYVDNNYIKACGCFIIGAEVLGIMEEF